MVPNPPTPLDTMTPKRSLLIAFIFPTISLLSPLHSIASFAATIANWVNRSIFRRSLGSITDSKSRLRTSPANLTLRLLTSRSVIGPIPQTPFFADSHISLQLFPMGVTAPIPVMTTLFFKLPFLHPHLISDL